MRLNYKPDELVFAQQPPSCFGIGCAAFGCAPALLLFTWLALLNVWNGIALIASIIWLVIVAVSIRETLRENHGPRQLLINLVGLFAKRKYLRMETREGQPRQVCFGFYLRGKRHNYHPAVPAEDIHGVSHGQGQASSISGSDQDDWWVAVEYGDGKYFFIPRSGPVTRTEARELNDKIARFLDLPLAEPDATDSDDAEVDGIEDAELDEGPPSDAGDDPDDTRDLK